MPIQSFHRGSAESVDELKRIREHHELVSGEPTNDGVL
jgi:hypothetical protein